MANSALLGEFCVFGFKQQKTSKIQQPISGKRKDKPLRTGCARHRFDHHDRQFCNRRHPLFSDASTYQSGDNIFRKLQKVSIQDSAGALCTGLLLSFRLNNKSRVNVSECNPRSMRVFAIRIRGISTATLPQPEQGDIWTVVHVYFEFSRTWCTCYHLPDERLSRRAPSYYFRKTLERWELRAKDNSGSSNIVIEIVNIASIRDKNC